MTLDEAINHYGSLRSNTNHAVPLCAAAGGEMVEAINAIALRIARRFLDHDLPFDNADSVASTLFGYVTMTESFKELPEPMYSIFLAFDAGEYRRGNDPPEVDPVEKYTVPLLREVLTARDAT